MFSLRIHIVTHSYIQCIYYFHFEYLIHEKHGILIILKHENANKMIYFAYNTRDIIIHFIVRNFQYSIFQKFPLVGFFFDT